MKKHTSKLIALVLALCLCLSLSVSAFAAEIDSSGGSGSTPVNLSSTSDGTEGGDPSATAMRVTVPTALPMAMSQDGDVTTANNCQIVNHSYGAVRVKSVSITAASGWKLTAFGNKSILAGEKVDSNKLGFAISIGGGQQKATDASNANNQTLIDAPIAGCYMTGAGDSTGNTAKIDYAAIVTPLSSAVTGASAPPGEKYIHAAAPPTSATNTRRQIRRSVERFISRPPYCTGITTTAVGMPRGPPDVLHTFTYSPLKYISLEAPPSRFPAFTAPYSTMISASCCRETPSTAGWRPCSTTKMTAPSARCPTAVRGST